MTRLKSIFQCPCDVILTHHFIKRSGSVFSCGYYKLTHISNEVAKIGFSNNFEDADVLNKGMTSLTKQILKEIFPVSVFASGLSQNKWIFFHHRESLLDFQKWILF